MQKIMCINISTFLVQNTANIQLFSVFCSLTQLQIDMFKIYVVLLCVAYAVRALKYSFGQKI